MSCFSPCIIRKYYKSDGTKDFQYLGKADSAAISGLYSTDQKFKNWNDDNFVLVPCGNCIGCRLDYSSTWADRLLCESFESPALFVTLTYDDDNVNVNRFGLTSISNEDIDKFIKDLRNYFRDRKIRYALATEYGDDSLRAHAHLILFNVTLEELGIKFYKLNQALHPMFSSSVLNDIWQKGFVVVEDANYYNMAYTSRYILKKQKGVSASEYDAFELTPPSFRMSRRPGIGASWLEKNYEELYTNGFVSVSRDIKSDGKITPNRYFDKLMDEIDNSLLFEYKKKARQRSFNTMHEKLSNSSFTLDKVSEYFEFAKENFLKKNQNQRCNFS